MPTKKYSTTRTDGAYIGKAIKEIIRLTIEEGMSWQKAADQVGLSRPRAARAVSKAHVISYRREQRAKFIELLSVRVPHKLNALMDSENAAAAVRATLALEDLAQQSRGEPSRRIQTGGIVIVLGNPQQALPGASALTMPVIEHTPTIAHGASDD